MAKMGRVRATLDESIVGVRAGDTGQVCAVGKDDVTVLWDRPSANGNPRYTSVMAGNISPLPMPWLKGVKEGEEQPK